MLKLFKQAIIVAAICSVPVALTAGAAVNTQWLIIPGGNVGPISPTASEADLIKIFGKDNVLSTIVDVDDEGMEQENGTIIYPKDPSKKISILWKDQTSKKNLKRVEITGNETMWKTEYGITLGTSLKELERINGGEFTISGFGWDNEGWVISWESGKLYNNYGKHISIRFTPYTRVKDMSKSLVPDSVTADEFESVGGERIFGSKNPVMQKINPTVNEILIHFK